MSQNKNDKAVTQLSEAWLYKQKLILDISKVWLGKGGGEIGQVMLMIFALT